MKEFFLEEKGLYFRTNDFASNRRTLVFIHGVSGSSSAWVAYEKELENDYNMIFFDFRGHGKSVKYKNYNDYAIDKFSDDIEYLLDYLKVKKCVLISHSFAVFPTLRFIEKNKDKIDGVVFISSYFALSKMKSAMFAKMLFRFGILLTDLTNKTKNLFLKSDNQKKLKIGKHLDYSRYKGSGDWNVRRTIADVSNTSLSVFLYTTLNAYNFDGESVLDKIDFPVVMIHGEKDTIIPLKYGISMSNKIKTAKLFILKDIDHIVVLNKPKEVLGIIKSFMKELNSSEVSLRLRSETS
jgi:pimeloyl-ACP methyl ester carboxylesterase